MCFAVSGWHPLIDVVNIWSTPLIDQLFRLTIMERICRRKERHIGVLEGLLIGDLSPSLLFPKDLCTYLTTLARI